MSFLRRMLLSFIAGSLLTTGVGCQSSYKYTLNPDGSGKVVYSVTLIKNKRDNTRQHPEAVLTKSAGVEAWEDAKVVLNQDGDEVFTATAYFKNLAELNLYQADQLRLRMIDNGDGTKTLRFAPKKRPRPPSEQPLTEEQIEAEIAKIRENHKSFKTSPMRQMMGNVRHTYTVQPPGRIQSVSNLKRNDDGTLKLVFDVAKMMNAMDAIVVDDQLVREVVRRRESLDQPGDFMMELVNERLFGTRGPVEAVLAGPFEPLFDYQQAVAAAEADPIRVLLSSGLIPNEMPKAGAAGNISDITNKTAQVKGGKLRLSFAGRLPKAGTKAQGAELYRVVDNQDRMLVPAIGVSRRGGGFLNNDGQTVSLSFHMRNAPQDVNSIKYAAGVFYYDIVGSESLHNAGEIELKVGAQNAAKNFRILGLDQNEDGFFIRWQADAPPMLYGVTFKVGEQTVTRFDTVPVPEARQVENTWISLGGEMPQKAEVVFHVTDSYEQVEAPFVLENVPVELVASKPASTEPAVSTAGKLPEKSLEDVVPTVGPAACQYSNDGKLFATAPHDVLVFDAVTRKLVKRFRVTGMPIVTIDFSDDATLMAIGVKNYDEPADDSVGMEIVVVRVADGKEIARFPGLRAQINMRRRLAISPDNKAIANSNAEGITVFDIASGKPIWEWTIDHETNPNWSYSDFHMTPDWKFFLFNLQRISYPTKETSTPPRFEDERPFFWINRISPDGKKALAVGGPNGTNQRVFDLATGQLLQETEGMMTSGVAVSPDFGMVVNERGYWYTETGKAVKIKPYGNDGIGSMAFHPNGEEVTVGARYYQPAEFKEDQTKSVKLPQWGRKSPSYYFSLKGAFAAENEFVLAAGRDRRTIDLTARRIGSKERGELNDYSRPDRFGFSAQAYSPDMKIRIDRDGNIFDPDTSREPTGAIFSDAEDRPRGTPFFASERVVAFVAPKKLYVYNFREKKIHRSYDFQSQSEIVQMSSSRNGRMLGILEGHFRIGHRRYVRVIDLAKGKEAVPVQLKPLCRIALSPSGRYLLVYGHMWCEVYDTESKGKRVKTHTIGDGTIRDLDLSPSGNQAAIMLSDRVTIMALPSCTPIATVVTGGTAPLDNIGLFDANGKLVAFEGDHRAIFAE